MCKKELNTQKLISPVLYTCNSSTIPSFPPPKTTISSFMATARCPCLGRGTGPDHPRTRFHRGCRTDAVVPVADMTSTKQKNKNTHFNAYCKFSQKFSFTCPKSSTASSDNRGCVFFSPSQKTGKRTAAKVTWIIKVAITKYKSRCKYFNLAIIPTDYTFQYIICISASLFVSDHWIHSMEAAIL